MDERCRLSSKHSHPEFKMRPKHFYSLDEEPDQKREGAYKAVLIISLSLTVCSWACMSSIFPLLYQFMSLANSQYGTVLEFCEETAQTVADDSAIIVQKYTKYTPEERIRTFREDSTKREPREAVTPSYVLLDGPDKCRCEAQSGARGLPGRKGIKGVSGSVGPQGKNARLPCQPLIDLKKYCPEQCPQGNQGFPGPRGAVGEKGPKGFQGIPGVDGRNGTTGSRGIPGAIGIPGVDGDEGDPGVDTMPSPFIPGPIGPVGEVGERGPPGPRGMPGIDGPQGPQGRRGSPGRNGFPGQQGTPGQLGPMGEAGDEGHQGVCPTYCATDGGVFFVEPPEWFFKDQQ